MKTILLQAGVLLALTAAAVAVGYLPTRTHWGTAGLNAMWAAAVICLVAGLLAVAVLASVLLYWPAYAVQAAFAGTAIRLLVTGALAVAYQVLYNVYLTSFLCWLLVLYLLLMTAETGLSIVLVRRCFRSATPTGGEAE